MSKDRIIHLLTDEEISLILTGLRFLSKEYKEKEYDRDSEFTDSLYSRIDKSQDVGVIRNERI